MLIGIFYSQIVESSSLVSVLFREAISHPYISFFHLLVNGFSVTSFRNFSFTVWTKKSAKRVRKQVTECLQNLYQSVANHLKYVLLVLI